MWQCAVLFGAGSNAACRIVQCIPDASTSTIGSQAIATPGRTIQGRVLAIETGAPVPSARIRLITDSAWASVDSSGVASLHVGATGSYTLAVTAPGYVPATRVMTLRGDSGVAWVALLARSRRTPHDAACPVDSINVTTDTP
jgi:hypothetical protein